MKRWNILIPLLSILATVVLGQTIRRLELTSFNAGQMSPLMNARSDYARTKSGARTLQNMLVRAQGPVQRRPGTRYIATVKDSNDPARLIPFEYSTSDTYILELGDKYMRFYRSGEQILNDSNEPFEVTAPWDANDLFEIQFTQDAEVMRLVHPDYPPYKLIRNAHANWSLTAIPFEHGPFLDENENSYVTIDPSGTGVPDCNDGYTTGQDGHRPCYAHVWLAQTFQASSNYTASGVRLLLFRYGTVGTMTVSIRATAAGLPTGPDLATATSNGDSLNTSMGGDWREFTFSSGLALTSGTTYAIVLRAPNVLPVKILGFWIYLYGIAWRSDGSAPAYANGQFASSVNSGGAWTANSGVDMLFEVVDVNVPAAGITLTANAQLFDEGHVGSIWRLAHTVPSTVMSGVFTAYSVWETQPQVDQNSPTFDVSLNQDFTVVTTGYWKGMLTIQKTYNNGVTWINVYSFQSATGLENLNYAGTETQEDAKYRLFMENHVGYYFGKNNYTLTFNYTCTALSYVRRGIVRITGYTDPCNVSADVLYRLGSDDPTTQWAEGAWSDYRGWPRTIEHHEQRCVYGGSRSYPQTIWGSVTAREDADYDDFSEGAGNADDAWTYVLPGMNPVQWMRSSEYLMIGTSNGVGRLGLSDKPISPVYPPIYRKQTNNGCAYIQAVCADDAILYVERGALKVRELNYAYNSDKFVAPDMTILAEDITKPGIVQIAFQNRPDPILWCVRSDGVLLSFTYQRKHDILAWSTHNTGLTDDVNSVAVIPGVDEDVCYWMVRRDVNNASVGMIETMQPFDWGADQNDCWFVDAGTNDVNGLTYLEGRTVVLWADGRPIETDTFTVSAGAIDPNDPNLTAFTVGLPFTSIFETMPIVTFDVDGTLTAAARARLVNVQVDCYKSLGFHIGSSAANSQDIRFSNDAWATTIDVYTGLKPAYAPLPFAYGWTRDPTIYVHESSPVPLTVRGLICNVEVAFD